MLFALPFFFYLAIWKKVVMAGALVATLEHEDEGVQYGPPKGM